MTQLLLIDNKIFKIINNYFAHPLLDKIMLLFSSNFFYAVVISLLLFYALKAGHRRLLLAIVVAAFCASMSDLLAFEWLKPFFARDRPCYDGGEFVRIVAGCAGQFGFPSNHAANSMAIAAALWLVVGWRWGLLGLGLAFLIGLSRVYLGVHYPLDVIAGFCFGVLTSVSIYLTLQPLIKLIIGLPQPYKSPAS